MPTPALLQVRAHGLLDVVGDGASDVTERAAIVRIEREKDAVHRPRGPGLHREMYPRQAPASRKTLHRITTSQPGTPSRA